MTIEAFAAAKINLTLHVTGQRADGYHLLDSLVMFADFGDQLWLEPCAEMALEVRGPFAAGVPCDGRNLVWQAAELAGWRGRVQLHKNLPHGAGIGGGSSDAAAVLRALDFAGDGAALGADVPVCKLGKAARMRGIGDVVAPVPGLPEMFAVLVNPGVHVPTPQVFSALETKANPAMQQMPQDLSRRIFTGWIAQQRNDLERAAIACQPVIGDVLKALSDVARASVVRMSGSGATCFALFESDVQAELAANNLAKAHPEWWVRDCRLS